MKKMFFAFSMLLVSSAFAITTPVPTPWTGPCTGEGCDLTREASIDLLALRGGIDADLRICRIELNHLCENCQEDSIKLLMSSGSPITIQNGGFWADTNVNQPLRAVLFLNSLRKGQTFAITFCASARRVIVGDALLNSGVNFAGSFDVNAGAVGNLNTPFNGAGHIDGLRYKVERKCGDQTRFTEILAPLALILGQNNVFNTNFMIPTLLQVGATGNVPTLEGFGTEHYRCVTGACQFKVTFGEFDRCFRQLDDLCADGDCKPTAMLLKVRGRVTAQFSCLDNDPTCNVLP